MMENPVPSDIAKLQEMETRKAELGHWRCDLAKRQFGDP